MHNHKPPGEIDLDAPRKKGKNRPKIIHMSTITQML